MNDKQLNIEVLFKKLEQAYQIYKYTNCPNLKFAFAQISQMLIEIINQGKWFKGDDLENKLMTFMNSELVDYTLNFVTCIKCDCNNIKDCDLKDIGDAIKKGKEESKIKKKVGE